MEKFLQKLIRIIEQEFPGAQTDIEVTVPGQKVGGFVIWDGFEGLEHIDRQHLIWDKLDALLTKDERRSINAMLTMTPSEMAVARQG